MSIVANRMARQPGLLLIALLLVVVSGCGNSHPPQEPANAQATKSGQSAPNTSVIGDSLVGELVTQGEYYDFARVMEQDALLTSAELGPHFDMEAMYDTALQDLDLSASFKKNVKAGALKTASGVALAEGILKATQEEGHYRLLHVHRTSEDHFALFRILSAGEMHYHNLKLSKNSQGVIRVTDIYVLDAGEYMTETIKRTLLPAVAHENRGLEQRFTQSDEELLAHMKELKELIVAGQLGDHARVQQIYASMPKSMQEMKPVQLRRVASAAEAHDPAEFATALAEFRRLYPGDRAVDIMVLEMLIQDKKFEAALEAIDRIDVFVGIDPFLDSHRAAVHIAAGNNAAAERLLVKLTADPSTQSNVYWHLIELALANQDHAKTLQYLLEMERRYAMRVDDLKAIPKYAGFVASPQYQQWLKRGEMAPE